MSLRSRIFLAFALTITAGIFGVFYWFSTDLLPRYLEAQEDTLADTAHVLAAHISAGGLKRENGRLVPNAAYLNDTFSRALDRPIRAQIYDLLKTGVDLRFYVTDRIGTVLFDSDGGRDEGMDYSQWRDVDRALDDQYGARTTQGDPLYPEGATMYVAAPIYAGGAIVGVVGVGKSTRNAERFVVSAAERFFMAAALVLVTALVLGALLHEWVSRPLDRLHQFAVDLRGGKRVSAPKLGNDETGRIGKAIVELRDALDGKTYVEQYVQSLAHELKSPTAAIAGAAELLDEDLPSEQRKRFLANIQRESRRLNDMVMRVLDLASLENQTRLQRVDTVCVNSLIRDCADSQLAHIRAKGIVLRTRCPETLTVSGDPFLLARALTNVLSNAIDFSPEAGTVTIEACATDATTRIVVTDQGPGIPEYAQERVYERFFSLARSDGSKGTGLGLSFVAEIMALHGGCSAITAGQSGGTRVTLSLPCAGKGG